MKKFFLMVAALAALCTGASAKAKQSLFGFNFDAGMSLSGGKVNELVFNEGDVLSQLEWHPKAVPQLDVLAEMRIWNFFLDAKLSVGLPGTRGIITDTDWRYGPGDASDISTHKIRTERKIAYDFLLGYNYSCPVIYVKSGLGFAGRSMKFSNLNGSGSYNIDTENELKLYFNGTGIDYELKTYSPELYFKVGCPVFKRRLGLDFALYGALYFPLKYTSADNHYFRALEFKEIGRKAGFGFMVGAEVYWRRIGLFFQYERFKNHKGSCEIHNTGPKSGIEVTYKDNQEGFDTSLLTLGLNFRF